MKIESYQESNAEPARFIRKRLRAPFLPPFAFRRAGGNDFLKPRHLAQNPLFVFPSFRFAPYGRTLPRFEEGPFSKSHHRPENSFIFASFHFPPSRRFLENNRLS